MLSTLLQCIGAGLGTLAVLRAHSAGDSDGTNNLAVHNQWNTSLQGHGAFDLQELTGGPYGFGICVFALDTPSASNNRTTRFSDRLQ